MTKRMKKKLVAICISCAVVFTGPGMSMVTRAYADEITQDQQQDGNSGMRRSVQAKMKTIRPITLKTQMTN